MPGYSFDLQRIFIGDLPLLFLLEIVMRTIILYGFALICMRLLGSRSTRELTPVDIILIVALGSAVGDPMFYADVPVLHGMTVIGLVAGLQHLGMLMTKNHRRIEKAIKGSPACIITDGVFDLESKKKSEFSRAEIFAMLRQHGYNNLGEVERLYIETDGSPSHYPFSKDKVKPGLPLTPPWELEAPSKVAVGTHLDEAQSLGCSHCGQVINFQKNTPLSPCPRCHHVEWIDISASLLQLSNGPADPS